MSKLEAKKKNIQDYFDKKDNWAWIKNSKETQDTLFKLGYSWEGSQNYKYLAMQWVCLCGGDILKHAHSDKSIIPRVHYTLQEFKDKCKELSLEYDQQNNKLQELPKKWYVRTTPEAIDVLEKAGYKLHNEDTTTYEYLEIEERLKEVLGTGSHYDYTEVTWQDLERLLLEEKENIPHPKAVPKGYEWTGELRNPANDEWFISAKPKDPQPLSDIPPAHRKGRGVHKEVKGKRYILRKLPTKDFQENKNPSSTRCESIKQPAKEEASMLNTIENKTFVNGHDVEDLSQNRLIELIVETEAEIEKLSSIKVESAGIKKKIKELQSLVKKAAALIK